MNIRIFSRPDFSFQLNLNNTDGVDTNSKTPITIISIDKIINTFISSLFFHFTSKVTQSQLPSQWKSNVPCANSFDNPINDIYYKNENTVKHEH